MNDLMVEGVAFADVLDDALRERVRPISRSDGTNGRHIVYWMHHAARGHENPALDVAIALAGTLDLPLVVYQGLGGGHRYDNDRHHTFILEGARDVRAELAARGIVHVFWLGAERDRPSPLMALAASAAVVVTEDFPAPPFPRWTARLAERAAAPVWAVDTACIVPMRLVDRAHGRAFQFRDATKSLRAERLTRPWIEMAGSEDATEPRPFDRATLPFDDVDLLEADIAELVARCPIDHGVGPVAHTRGGSTAGYERWRTFLDHGLDSYAARRNNAAIDGVSQLSPYLHHGHVSPFRIAREAAAVDGRGPAKFLDELLVWRELAHNLCLHRHAEIESLDVLPDWARATLAAHANDPRQALSWETLARGRTGDRLWDLCQTSLLRHGMLHNNVRMTWGKAVPGWSIDPEQALARLIDLNHRFALDGSDPNSYGGLLWCLGLFDRPFAPERPVLGTVRSRSTARHATRLDLDLYAKRVTRPATRRPLEVAIIGAGLSGLACARALLDHGHRPRVFEKARGVGGRMSTRRAGDLRFDHGAQYFTVRDDRFRRVVRSWRHDGIVDEWPGRIVSLDGRGGPPRDTRAAERYVGIPGMNAICRHLATDVDVELDTRVLAIRRDGRGWRLDGRPGDLGRFDAVVTSAPAPQSRALLAEPAPALAGRIETANLAPCWAVMVTFGEPLDLDLSGAFVDRSPLRWIARNGTKPGRPEAESWVLHASPSWSAEHLERDKMWVMDRLLEALFDATAAQPRDPVHLDAHRWRHALPTTLIEDGCRFDPDLWLGACGDWCHGARVEGAYLSGMAIAGRVLSIGTDARMRAS